MSFDYNPYSPTSGFDTPWRTAAQLSKLSCVLSVIAAVAIAALSGFGTGSIAIIAIGLAVAQMFFCMYALFAWLMKRDVDHAALRELLEKHFAARDTGKAASQASSAFVDEVPKSWTRPAMQADPKDPS